MDELFSTCSVILPDGEPPEWIQLMPGEGVINAVDGRSWTLRDAHAVVAASTALATAGGVGIAVDYDHATDLMEKMGGQAPAAGWIKEFQVRTDGIWGRVEWTARAAKMIREKEYRMISPAFKHLKNGTVTRIVRAALTNNPALQLTALAHQQHGDAHSMDEWLKELLAALGLPEGADKDKALAHAKTLVDSAKAAKDAEADRTALASVRTALKLGDDADGKAIATALTTAMEAKAKPADAADAGAADPDPNAFVPRAEFDRVATALASVQTSLASDKATEAVNDAMKAGKIAPASKDWAMDYAKKDLAGFTAFCSAAPVVVAPGTAMPDGSPPKASSELTKEDKAICAAMGLDEKTFLETRKEETAR